METKRTLTDKVLSVTPEEYIDLLDRLQTPDERRLLVAMANLKAEWRAKTGGKESRTL